jgi:hypothetical protein
LAERHAASPYLKNLLGIGVLDEKAVGRERVFVNPKLLKLLTEEANDFEPYSEENTRKVEAQTKQLPQQKKLKKVLLSTDLLIT